jgi:hypothetical protein
VSILPLGGRGLFNRTGDTRSVSQKMNRYNQVDKDQKGILEKERYTKS